MPKKSSICFLLPSSSSYNLTKVFTDGFTPHNNRPLADAFCIRPQNEPTIDPGALITNKNTDKVKISSLFILRIDQMLASLCASSDERRSMAYNYWMGYDTV
uniref:Uncharacterized protein n=1 Tax=Romanomermis culicivorax TaxID=13658 RepID=A0A915JRE4_ROMCU